MDDVGVSKGAASEGPDGKPPDEIEQVFAMIAFARARGISVPEAASELPPRQVLARGELEPRWALAAAHEALASALYPARPEAVAYLERMQERRGYKPAALGPVPFVRNLALTVLALLAILVSLLAIASVNNDRSSAVGFDDWGGSFSGGGGGVSGGGGGGIGHERTQEAVAQTAIADRANSNAELMPTVLQSTAAGQPANDDGRLAAVASVVAMIVAAALGAAFEALHRAMGDVEAATFDPNAPHSYYLRVVYGIAAGVILVLIAGDQALDAESLPLTTFGLALLGGFGAPAVYRILARLVRSLEDLVGPDPTDAAASATRNAQQTVEHEKLAVLPLVALALEEPDELRRREILMQMWRDLGGGVLP
jgi:roadblock/LC7 domain-containing protein